MRTIALTALLTVAVAGLAGVAQGRDRVVVREALLYQPRELTISGDGDLIAQRLQWRSWGGRTATASGQAVEQERPSHADHVYPARVTLSRRTYCPGIHRTVYDEVTLRIVGASAGVFGARTSRRVYTCAGTFTFS